MWYKFICKKSVTNCIMKFYSFSVLYVETTTKKDHNQPKQNTKNTSHVIKLRTALFLLISQCLCDYFNIFYFASTAFLFSVLGALSQKLLTMLTLLRRTLRSMSSHFYVLPYKKMLLATFLLYLVVVRLDPGRVLRSLSLSFFFQFKCGYREENC